MKNRKTKSVVKKFTSLEALEGTDDRILFGKKAREIYKPEIIQSDDAQNLLDRYLLAGTGNQVFVHGWPVTSFGLAIATLPGQRLNIVNTANFYGGSMTARQIASRANYANSRAATNITNFKQSASFFALRIAAGGYIGHEIGEQLPVYGLDSSLSGLAIRAALLLSEPSAKEARVASKDETNLEMFLGFMALPGAQPETQLQTVIPQELPEAA